MFAQLVQGRVPAPQAVERRPQSPEREAARLQFERHRQKAVIKSRLMKSDPTCCVCGKQLRATAANDNSAHVVRGKLTCPAHVDVVQLGTNGGAK